MYIKAKRHRAKNIPKSIIKVETISSKLSFSSKIIRLKNMAIIGTKSCKILAVKISIFGKISYQIK